MSKLRDLTIELGSDPLDWSRDDRREAVVELFEQDEREPRPDWIGDALSEDLVSNTNERRALIAALKHSSAAFRHAAIGIIVERALIRFPLDSLQRVAEEHEAEWRAEAAQCRAECELDSRREDAAMRAGMRALAAQGRLP